MLTYSLVVSTPSTGIEIIKVIAASVEDATEQFLSDSDNAPCELLHVVEPEPAQVEIVVDMTGCMIEQVLSNHPNTKIVFLDASKDEVGNELENDTGAFAPDSDLADDVDAQRRKPWVFRTAEADHNPRATGHYVRYTEDESAQQAFNEHVHQALGNR